MKAKLLSLEAKAYTNEKTGQPGTDHLVTLLTPGGVRIVRVDQAFYRAHQGIPQMSDVEVEFDFIEGRFGRHYATVVALRPLAVAK